MSDFFSKISHIRNFSMLKDVSLQRLMDLLGNRTLSVGKRQSSLIKASSGKTDFIHQPKKGTTSTLNLTECTSLTRTIKMLHQSPFSSPDNLSQLMILPESIFSEIKNQQNSATLFKSEFFDFLRSILLKHSDNDVIRNVVTEILSVYASKNDNSVKSIELLVDKLAQILLQFDDNETAKQLKEFARQLEDFLLGNKDTESESKNRSAVLEKILSFIESNVDQIASNKTYKSVCEQILRGLLMSQNLKLPMFHFILPVKYGNAAAFGELWVDPDDGRNENITGQRRKGIRMLLAIDIIGTGHFEADFLLEGRKLNVIIYCPPLIVENFAGLKKNIGKVITDSGFQTGRVEFMPLDRPRVLKDVFEKPLERRKGINVRV